MVSLRTEQSKGTAKEKEKARNSNLNFPCFLSNKWGVPHLEAETPLDRIAVPHRELGGSCAYADEMTSWGS